MVVDIAQLGLAVIVQFSDVARSRYLNMRRPKWRHYIL